MNQLYIFIIRIFLGAFFAVMIIRFFKPVLSIAYIAGLAVILVGLAYVSEYFRNRKKSG